MGSSRRRPRPGGVRPAAAAGAPAVACRCCRQPTGGPGDAAGERGRGGDAQPTRTASSPDRAQQSSHTGRRTVLGRAHRYSCSAPPWGELVAVNANTGDIAWHVPLGEFRGADREGHQDRARRVLGGAITTAGNLVFIGATIDGFFRAFDARNGKELWREKLPNPSHSTPTTYMGRDGKQYVVIGANGGGFLSAHRPTR